MASPKTIKSTVAFQDPQGNALASGLLVFDLSAPAEITSGGGIVAPSRVSVTLDSTGNIPASTVLWANDQLSPSGTAYTVRIYNSNGLLVSGPLIWSITGTSPIDLSQEIPVATSTLSFSLPGIQFQQFTSSGTFTIPAAITKVKVLVVAGGGAGGGSTAANNGAGGGAGSAAIKWLSGLTPGNTLTVTVGTGGAGASGANGNTGVASSVTSGTQAITSILTNAGVGGIVSAGVANGAPGGAAGTGGDINLGGSASGMSAANGGSATGGAGAGSILGGGGIGTVAGAGANASSPGAGGGGAGFVGGGASGGNGANGIVIFEWVA